MSDVSFISCAVYYSFFYLFTLDIIAKIIIIIIIIIMKIGSLITTIVSLCTIVQNVEATTNNEELQIIVKKEVECNFPSKIGDKISVHYTGKLSDGTVFDSSLARHKPIQFTLGKGQVIKGWDEGLIGACVGEKRDLYIPSALGYGSRGAGNVIPPNADLLFETELVAVKN